MISDRSFRPLVCRHIHLIPVADPGFPKGGGAYLYLLNKEELN